jgi:hypothetical protein
MSQPSPGNCPVQIQVYVDTNAAKQNSTDGVYMVDNRVNSGSTGEGSLGLDTHVSKASNVCFQVINIDATSDVTVEFTSFGNSNAWGTQIPAMWDNNAKVWTAQAANQGGNQPYSFVLRVGNATPFQVSVTTPTLTVS